MKPDCTMCLHVRRFLTAEGDQFCSRVEAARKANGVGRLCSKERDNIPEPQRPNGDKCGPEGIHFIQGEAFQ